MSPSEPVAHPLRHRRAIHVKVVERDAGLWIIETSSSGRRALAGHRETSAWQSCAALGLKSVIPALPAKLSPSRTAAVSGAGARLGRTPHQMLRGLVSLAGVPAHPDDATLHGEAPCRAGLAGDFTADAASEAEVPLQLDQCHARRQNGASVRQFYSRGYGQAAPQACGIAAPASRAGNEVQSNSQT